MVRIHVGQPRHAGIPHIFSRISQAIKDAAIHRVDGAAARQIVGAGVIWILQAIQPLTRLA